MLEAGCGAGFSVTYLRGRCSTYVGIDYSENYPSSVTGDSPMSQG